MEKGTEDKPETTETVEDNVDGDKICEPVETVETVTDDNGVQNAPRK